MDQGDSGSRRKRSEEIDFFNLACVECRMVEGGEEVAGRLDTFKVVTEFLSLRGPGRT